MTRYRIVCADGNVEDVPSEWEDDMPTVLRDFDEEDCAPHRVEEVPDGDA